MNGGGWTLPEGDFGTTELFQICEVAAEFGQDPEHVALHWSPAWLQIGACYARIKQAQRDRLEELRFKAAGL